MKRVLSEVLFVMVFFGIFFQFQSVRLPIVIAVVGIGFWIVPVQMLLSVSLKNWMNEFGGQFHKLSFEDRIVQIRSTFESLTEVEAIKLRWFYIQACLFHYLLMLLFALGFIIIAAFFLTAGAGSKELLRATISVIGGIGVFLFGCFIIPKMYPAVVRKNIDETLYLFLNKDWKKRLFREDSVPVEDNRNKTFYDFWLQGANLEEKQEAFHEFIKTINACSSNGTLLKINDQNKIDIKCVVHAKGLSKSLAGFLKYCIDEQHVLSDQILHHRYRELLRDVFNLDDLKTFVFLEGQRYKDTPVEYLNVYRSK